MKGTAREMTPPLCLHTSSSSSTKSKVDTSSPQTCAFNVVQKGRCNIVLIFGRCVRTAGINASLFICICVRLSALSVIIVLRRLLHSVSAFRSSFQLFLFYSPRMYRQKKDTSASPWLSVSHGYYGFNNWVTKKRAVFTADACKSVTFLHLMSIMRYNLNENRRCKQRIEAAGQLAGEGLKVRYCELWVIVFNTFIYTSSYHRQAQLIAITVLTVIRYGMCKV